MPKNHLDDALVRGEGLLSRAQKTDLDARAQIEAELKAMRDKTARLRELRLARDAAIRQAELDKNKKPAAQSTKPAAKAKKAATKKAAATRKSAAKRRKPAVKKKAPAKTRAARRAAPRKRR